MDPASAGIALQQCDGIGPRTALKILEHYDRLTDLFEEPAGHLRKLGFLSEDSIQLLCDNTFRAKARDEAERIEQLGGRVRVIGHDDYPRRLMRCADLPLVLITKGAADLDALRMVAVVGTRNISDYGRAACTRILEEIAPFGVTIVSGLAYGVDIWAHREALRMGIPTVACLAHGIDRIYPSHHGSEARKMLEAGGALISEFPLGTQPKRENFPERNRIIAGMSDATIVIESDRKGGSMITARIAASYNREVYAVPGRINDRYASGCNALIRGMEAQILLHGAQLAMDLGWKRKEGKKTRQLSLSIDLPEEQQKVFSLLQDGKPMHIDSIAVRTQLGRSALIKALFELEMNGVIRHRPGQQYVMNR